MFSRVICPIVRYVNRACAGECHGEATLFLSLSVSRLALKLRASKIDRAAKNSLASVLVEFIVPPLDVSL